MVEIVDSARPWVGKVARHGTAAVDTARAEVFENKDPCLLTE